MTEISYATRLAETLRGSCWRRTTFTAVIPDLVNERSEVESVGNPCLGVAKGGGEKTEISFSSSDLLVLH